YCFVCPTPFPSHFYLLSVDDALPISCPEGKILLVSDDPFSGYVKLVKHFHPFRPSNKMISDSAIIGEGTAVQPGVFIGDEVRIRSEEHTSELQSRFDLVCRLLLEKKK